MFGMRILANGVVLEITLRDTETSRAIMDALPFEATAQTWGDEVYFSTPVSVKLEADAKQVVEPGTVCFWTEGDALALPFGPTPISTDEKPKLASRCNVLGRIVGDAKALAGIKAGAKVRVEKA